MSAMTVYLSNWRCKGIYQTKQYFDSIRDKLWEFVYDTLWSLEFNELINRGHIDLNVHTMVRAAMVSPIGVNWEPLPISHVYLNGHISRAFARDCYYLRY